MKKLGGYKNIVRFVLMGGFVGFFIIFYDYDFLLNPGGPETPITHYIVDAFNYERCCFKTYGMATLFMVLIGMFSGFITWAFFNNKK